MDYEHFLKQVAEDLRYSIPGATVEMSDVVKVQGESYRGISVRMNDSPIAASMNLRGAHERLMDGADYHDILQSIHDQAIEAVSQGRGFDLDLVQDYGKAKERLCMEVIPIKGNEELLTGIPHTVMEDLAVIHRIDIDDHAVVTVTNNLLDHFGISEEQLHADALVSAPEIRPAKVLPMHEMLGIPEAFVDPAAPVLYVATTSEQVKGAGVIAYPGLMEEAAEKLGGDFFILPSSVHEVLFLPQKGDENYRDLQAMVREINETQVAPEERLSDEVYHYDSRDKVFERAESFEKRMKNRTAEKSEGRTSMLEKLKEKKVEAAKQPRKAAVEKGREALAL